MSWPRRFWERVLLYLPLIFMGLLALGTYWLVRTAPDTPTQRTDAALPPGPDYFLENFVTRSFDATGQLRTEVQGDKATHFPDQKIITIDNIRLKSVDMQGRARTASALRGISDDAQTQFELIGQAQVVREAYTDPQGQRQERTQYRGEYLMAHLKEEIVTSNQPVELLRSGGDRFTADTLRYDHTARTVQLEGRVRGTLVPRISPTPAAAVHP